MLKPINIGIWGAGNLAYHLATMLQNVAQIQLYNRDVIKSQALATELNVEATTNKEAFLDQKDFIFLAVADDALAEVSKECFTTDAIVIHSSGAKPLAVLEGNKNTAVVYPLQTFTKGTALNYTSIPFFLETASIAIEAKLDKVFSLLSINLLKLNSTDRLKLHAAAVFCSNFINAQFIAADALLGEHSEALLPHLKKLSEEVVRKAFANKPSMVQTGPAKRKDVRTMQQHLSLLKPAEQDLYKYISAYITKIYE